MKHQDIAFVDLEMTSLDPFTGEIIEIGVVIARQVAQPGGGVELQFVSEHEIALLPEHIETADPESLKVNGYHERTWDHAVPQREGLLELATHLKGKIFVAQNVVSDWSFLLHAGHTYGIDFDALVHYHKLDLASMVFGKFYAQKELARFSLREMAQFFGVEHHHAHTALADAQTTFTICQRALSTQ